MMTTKTEVITFKEFEALPNPPNGAKLELRHGVPTLMPPADIVHYTIQIIVADLLKQLFPDAGLIGIEMAFYSGDDYRIIDVGMFSRERWVMPEKYIEIAPDVAVEVLSPSNTVDEIADKMEF